MGCARLEGDERSLLKIENLKWLDSRAEVIETEADTNLDSNSGDEEEQKERTIKDVKIPYFCPKDMIEDFPAYVNVYGTKIANLIVYLSKYTKPPYSERVIVFSQWDNLLKSMGDTLNKLGLVCSMCKGNVFVKRKALSGFRNNSGNRILLLSSKYAASGLDLIEADKIVFIDPVYAEHDVKESIEKQAIGRIDRLGQKRELQIVKLLIRDTIEETSYKKYRRKYKEKLLENKDTEEYFMDDDTENIENDQGNENIEIKDSESSSGFKMNPVIKDL